MDEKLDELTQNKTNVLSMKLLHYFITKKNYNPIIIQGVENEIWLENMDEDYEIVRIVSENILNEEQLGFDIFKTKRIVNKIKRKTLTLKMKTLSIFLNLHENIEESPHDNTMIKIDSEKDLSKSDVILKEFPDLPKEVKMKEKGIELFANLTNDINEHSREDSRQFGEIFGKKTPFVTYTLIAICVLAFIIPYLTGKFNEFISLFAVYKPAIVKGEYYRLLTAPFLHANIAHIVFNCYALYVIGRELESYIGHFKFLIVYLFSAITGSLMSIIFLGNGVSVGASGAIFGLMGSLIYFGFHYRVYLEQVLKREIIPLVILNLLLGFIIKGVDNYAHIGGLIGGFLITVGLGIKYKETTFEKVNGYIMSIIYLIFLIYMGFTPAL